MENIRKETADRPEENNSERELILIGISESESCARVIRAAGRLSRQLNAQLRAVFVDTGNSEDMSEADEKALNENRNLAKAFGAEIITTYGNNIAYQLSETAKVCGATKLFIGMSRRRFYRKKEDVGFLVKKHMPSLDVYIIPGRNLTGENGKLDINAAVKNHTYKKRAVFTMFLSLIGVMCACTLIGLVFQKLDIPYVNIVMIYILGVLLLSTFEGNLIYMAIASFVSVMTVNYFFVEPLYCFQYAKETDFITFIMMFFMAFIISSRMGKMKLRFDDSYKRSMRTDILFDSSTLLLKAKTVEDVEKIIAEQLTRLTRMSVVIYSNYEGTPEGPKYFPRQGVSEAQMYPLNNNNDKEAVLWVFKNGARAGYRTQNAHGAMATYLPVKCNNKIYAAVGLHRSDGQEIPQFEFSVIAPILSEAGLVINRIIG